MAELETYLRDLGRRVEFPPTPDFTGHVRAQLRPQRRDWRRPAAIALAVLAVAIGAALAVPSARSAILEWLGLEGVTITRVESLPAVPATGNLDLGQELPLAQARRRATWLVVPSDAPDHVYLSSGIPGGKVTLLWGSPTKVRLLLTEFRGEAYLEKIVTQQPKWSSSRWAAPRQPGSPIRTSSSTATGMGKPERTRPASRVTRSSGSAATSRSG